MVKPIICFFLINFFLSSLNAQNINSVIGKIVDSRNSKNLQEVNVFIQNTLAQGKSNIKGEFQITSKNKGELILVFEKSGYEILRIPVNINEEAKAIDLGIVRLEEETEKDIDQSFISLNEGDLVENEKGETNNISGLLVASKDIFLRTVAYEFSPTFFKPRSLGSEYSQVSLNGINMNKMYNNRPQWSNWGGLNDVLRNQEFSLNISPSEFTFGGLSGSTNLNTFASGYRKGTKVSYASSNRSYKGRFMGSYSSGVLQNGWAFTFSASYRFANEGFKEGTLYSANSFFTSIDKRISEKHLLNFTGIYASNIRGKSSPNTQEVYDLKSIKYNSYWGNQDDKIRNSRVREIAEPILQINHLWDINSTTTLQTNLTYQFGKIGNSRLDYGGTRIVTDNEDNQNIVGGGSNPDPTYYQKLPSYFLRDQNNPDYENAYLAEQEFLENGQIKWEDLYASNQNTINNGNSIYALYEDRNDDKQLSFSSFFYKKININFTLNASLNYKILKSENYANMLDLLGGNGYLDVDIYADNIDEAQSDLQNPNRIITKNDRFKYNFNFNASELNGFVQTQYSNRKTDAFIALNYNQTNYQRNGLFENGAYPGERSLGKSKKINFSSISAKGGLTYKFSGRHIFSTSIAYNSKPPTLQNSFSNARENNDIVIGLTNEKIFSFDASYFLRHPKINAKFTGYWINLKDQTDISFYFADGLTGIENSETTAFVQEVLIGIDKQNIGVEIGVEVPIITSFKVKGVAAIGQSIYSSNPNLYLTSDDFSEPLNYGEVYLKNYFVSGGPQQAYSFGFEYSSPKYWWLSATANYFRNAYINVAPILRTNNFYMDNDGLPINNYDEQIAKKLLQQEKFKAYYLVNIVGGKSWKIKDYYFGFFANVSNILNNEYKTGGFEQSRNANYNTLLEDKTRDKPLFAPKYWFGYGTSYYASVYFRF